MRKTVLIGVLATAMLFGIVGLAVADSVEYPGSGNPLSTATNSASPVQVKATVNPKITLTIDTPDPSQEVFFGTVDPEDPQTANVELKVKSNKSWDMTVDKGGNDTELGLTTTYENGMTDQPKGTWIGTDTYTIDIPYSTDPGDYIATVQYTVTQK